MTECELELGPLEVQEGDIFVAIGADNVPMGPYSWAGLVAGKAGLTMSYIQDMAKSNCNWRFKVRRTMGRTMVSKVPDWPLACPRCGRHESAVLLFQSYDCRHGCYRG